MKKEILKQKKNEINPEVPFRPPYAALHRWRTGAFSQSK
jgi:hypothetical protein